MAKAKSKSIRLRIFEALSRCKSPYGLTAKQIIQKAKLDRPHHCMKDEVLSAKPRFKRTAYEGERGVYYALTRSGVAALRKGTVDSEAPSRTIGHSELNGTA